MATAKNASSMRFVRDPSTSSTFAKATARLTLGMTPLFWGFVSLGKLLLFTGFAVSITLPQYAFAQESQQEDIYARASVLRLLEKGEPDALALSAIVQQVRVRMISGPEKGKEVTAQNTIVSRQDATASLAIGDEVIVLASRAGGGDADYYVVDYNRTVPLTLIFRTYAQAENVLK